MGCLRTCDSAIFVESQVLLLYGNQQGELHYVKKTPLHDDVVTSYSTKDDADCSSVIRLHPKQIDEKSCL